MRRTRKTLVLVDDNPINLKLARNTLMEQYDVFTVPSADKLFQLLGMTLPDLILLDVLMPRMNGYEVIAVLKSDPRTAGIPVIFLTSKSDTISELEGFTLGAVDYISKPFSPQLLLKRVEVHLLLESQRHELENLNQNARQMADEKSETMLELQNAILLTLCDLAEYRGGIFREHTERTGRFLRAAVDEMMRQGLYREVLETWDVDLFLQASRLHDIGKIVVSDAILLKHAPLSGEEFDLVKAHTTLGEAVIERIQRSARESMLLTHAKIMAGTHHERWDGAGYPRRIAGSNIPLQGRLMSIADAYNALISDRPYRRAFDSGQALDIIKEGRGTQFDPDLDDIFIKAVRNFP
jgi:putative two-component system response regulator